jgi:ubiquinone/menaquinone biosynthesis C-methylase UbiE
VTRHVIDYNKLAETYNARYVDNPLQEIADVLVALAARFQNPTVLEVGCGTGRWLQEFASFTVGVDYSIEMLRRAGTVAHLVNASANSLPFRIGVFNLIYCVNALHHFPNPQQFICDSAPLLKPGGVLAIIGIDPRTIRMRYFYDYFDRALTIDLQRYPSFGRQLDWMSEAGFDQVEHRIVHTWTSHFRGSEIFSDPFLRQESNSLLALLSTSEYHAGLQRIEAAVAKGSNVTFDTEIPFGMVTGRRS